MKKIEDAKEFYTKFTIETLRKEWREGNKQAVYDFYAHLMSNNISIREFHEKYGLLT